MDVIEAIKQRKSVRAFLDKEVTKETLVKILDAARWAPSGVNHQPWQIASLGEATRSLITNQFIEAFEAGVKPNPDYTPPLKDWADIYKKRRKDCGMALYNSLGISLEDTLARQKLWKANYTFFNAPAAFIVYIDKNMPQSSWIDMGIFIQNILIAAKGLGLSTCSQAAFSDYPDIIRKILGLSNVDIICGISIGYEDLNHPINSYRTQREEVNRFTRWYE